MITSVPNETKRYTIRNIPPSVDRALKKRARELGLSLNEVVLLLLKKEAYCHDTSYFQHNDPKTDRDWETA